MSLAAGVLSLLEYVLGNVVHPGELRGLLDCLGNSALHMAAQCQKCSALVRLDVMTLLVEAGVDETARNIEGKTAGSYLSGNEEDCLQSHHEYNLICSGLMAKKMKQAVDKIYDNVDNVRREDDTEEFQESTQDKHIQVQEKQTIERTFDATPKTHSKEDDAPDNNTVENTTDLLLQKMMTVGLAQNCNLSSRIQDAHKYNDSGQSLETIAEENSFQYETTNNQRQPVPVTEEEEMPVREPQISVSQGIDGESSRNFNTDVQITNRCLPVESVPDKPKLIEFNLETIKIDLQNGLPEQQVISITEKASNTCEVSQVDINSENVHVNVVKTYHVSDDVGDDNSSFGSLEHNKSCGSDMEVEVSLNKSTIQSSQYSKKQLQSSDVLRDRAACAALQYAGTDKDNDGIKYTASIHVQASLFGSIAPYNNDNVSVGITSVQKNDYRDHDEIQVAPKFNDNPETENKAENESNCSELGQDVTRNDTMVKSSQESVTQSHKLSKKSPEVLKEKDANDENIDVQSLLNKDILLKHIAPDDNSSPVLIKVHDDDNSQAQKKAETKSSGSEIGYGVSHKDIMSKFSQDSLTKQQDVLQEESLSEKFQCGNTCAIPLEDMVSNDNGCRHPFDQVETVNLDLKNGLPQQQVYPITGKSSYNECETNTTPQHRSQFFQLAPVETKTKPVAKKPGKCKQTQRSSTKETKEQKVFEDTSSYQDNKHEQCCPAEKTSETSESCLSYNMDEDKMLTLPEQGTDQIQVTLDSPVRARENQMTSLQNGPELMVSKERPYFLQTHVSKRTELRNFQMMSKHDHTEEDSTDSEHINENENICNDISSTTVGELTSTTDANGKSKSYGCAPTKQSHYGETEEKIALDKRYDQTFNRKRPISKRRDLCLEIKHLISDIQNPPSIFYREAEKEDDATEKNKDFGEDSSNTEMYDCTNGVLELECTEEFWKTMCSDQMPLDIKRRALRILKQLASGEKCHYRNSPSNENIFKAKILPEVYIIWGTARVYSHRLNNSDETEMRRDLGTKHPKVIYSEVIRIWDIVRGSEEMEKCTKRLKEISQRHNRCLQQTHLTGQVTKLSQRAYIPSIFTVSESQDVSNVISVPKYLRRQNGIQKFYLISPEMIRCFIQSNLSNVTFPFRLSYPERDIVDLQSDLPVFLLGENGSGKTTCCMYRLLQIWLANRKTSTAGSGPNAIDESADFNGSDENDTYLCQSTETDTKFAEADIGENNILRPIFITKDRWKAKEAKEIFLGLCCGSDPSPKNINRKEQELPESFQNASNDICPLFLTMQQFLFILDSSLGEPKFFEGNKADMNSWVNVLDTLELGHPSVPVKGKLLRQVTYEVFRDEVWPKLGKAFDGKYDLSFVWIEILNHIAGSIEAISQRSGILTKEQYVGKARLRTVYSKEDLSHIYDMFKRYDNLKTQKGYFDVTDLLHSIMTRIQTEPSVPFVFQHIFADDVQDFNSAEISLLLSFSSEPNTVFLSGTQKEHHVSISDGVVKLLHFNGTHRSLVAIQPLIKYLPNEFGPSEGISSFANCIMHLMKDTSSYPLDAVEDKTSLFPGPRPVLLNSHNEIDLLDFLTVYRSTGLKLGANQVILVRDEHSRNNIPPKMKNSLILTLEEASGLRFDDVLLYNFFADSKVGKDIILLTKMDGKFENRKKKHDVDGNQTKMAKWDRFRRASLQRELQALYKASMTASNNLWIFDENSNVASSMYTYLQERNVAEVHQTAEY
ncbi:uncharacterized protein LOC110445000, partial [Mizuhopecten yessoensis]|uniref:uncharacterized protein LOC110445000 n=1 Tax=Mizuhopecten yessoensis TaxID=6573 RepID=UPI000B45E12F